MANNNVSIEGSFGPDYSEMVSGLSSAMASTAQMQASQNQFQLSLLQQESAQTNEFMRMRMQLDEASNNRFVMEQKAERDRALDMYKIRVAENESVLDRLRLDNEARKEEGKQHLELLKWQAGQVMQGFAAARGALELQRMQREAQDEIQFRAAAQAVTPQVNGIMADLTSSATQLSGAKKWNDLQRSDVWAKLNPAQRAEVSQNMERALQAPAYRVDGSETTKGSLMREAFGTDQTRASMALAALSGSEDPMAMADVDPAVRAKAATYKTLMTGDPLKDREIFTSLNALRRLEAKANMPGGRGRLTAEERTQVQDLKAGLLVNLPEASPFRSVLLSNDTTDPVASVIAYKDALKSTADARLASVQAIPEGTPGREAALKRLSDVKQSLDMDAPALIESQRMALSDKSYANRARAVTALSTRLGAYATELGFSPPPASVFVSQSTLDGAGRHMERANPVTRDQLQAVEDRSLLNAVAGSSYLNAYENDARSPLYFAKGFGNLEGWATRHKDVLNAWSDTSAKDALAGALFPGAQGYTVSPTQGATYGDSVLSALKTELSTGRYSGSNAVDQAVHTLVDRGILVSYADLDVSTQPMVPAAAVVAPIVGAPAAPSASPTLPGATPFPAAKK